MEERYRPSGPVAGSGGIATIPSNSSESGSGGALNSTAGVREVGGALGSAGQGVVSSVPSGPDPLRTPPPLCFLDQPCGSKADYVSIWGSSPLDIWVVATTPSTGKSALLHWDGLVWQIDLMPGAYTLNAVWGSAKDDVWVVGRSATVRHFDGSVWSSRLPPVGAPIDFTAVSGTSASDVWVVGWGMTIRHFDGAAWSSGITATYDRFLSVWASADEVWVLGDETINHFDRTSWTTAARPNDNDLTSVWGRLNHQAWVASKAGILQNWNLTEWQANAVDGQTAAVNFRRLWGSFDNDVWAMGEDGAVAHWDGQRWAVGPHLTDSNLNAAWGYPGSTWFVGDNGAFLKFDGTDWQARPDTN